MGENKLAFTVVGIKICNELQDAQSALPGSLPGNLPGSLPNSPS